MNKIYTFICRLGAEHNWLKLSKLKFEGEKEQLKNEQVLKGILTSGIGIRARNQLDIKQEMQMHEDAYKRGLGLLNILPSWLALLISLVALIISLVKKV